MNPKIWGRGGWYLIFVIIYYFNNILNNCNDVEIYNNNFERLKFIINVIISNLPCKNCQEHCKKNIIDNNIMSTSDPNIFLHFFIELYNAFHINSKIDRNNITLIKIFD